MSLSLRAQRDLPAKQLTGSLMLDREQDLAPSSTVGADLMQSSITMRIVKVDVKLRASVKQLGYFASLTQCSIGQQPIFGWFAVMPAALVALIFMCFGHILQNAALRQHNAVKFRQKGDDPGARRGGGWHRF